VTVTPGFQLIVAATLAFAAAYATMVALLRSALVERLLDSPNERSLHQCAVPRFGGLAIAAGLCAGLLVCWGELPRALRLATAGYAALLCVSWLDDVRGLPALPRLLAHLAVATAWALGLDLGPLGLLAGVLAIGWSANLFNFMDGADGLAGGMAVIGFGALSFAFAAAGAIPAAALCASIGAAALAFLAFNAPPARVFMGDCGSVPLGFTAAAVSLYGWHTGAWTLVFPLIVFLPFWFDASVTVAMRTLRGAHPWQAHREHFYQKAVRSGLGHRRVAHRAWALMGLCAALALVSREASLNVQALILFATSCANATAAYLIERRFRHSEPS